MITLRAKSHTRMKIEVAAEVASREFHSIFKFILSTKHF